MEYTEQQKAGFKDQFALRRKRQIILAIPMAAIFLAFAFLTDKRNSVTVPDLPTEWMVPIVFALVIGAIVFSLRNWRCPACDKYLGKGISPHFCPKCGVALQ
jgi:hypothetical protein